MHIQLAGTEDSGIVKEITCTTIREIYPQYYPGGAVAFFLEHHSDEAIRSDIAAGCVFLLFDAEQNAVGTVTIRENEICRLFVLPQYQGNGFGTMLLDFAEAEIAGHAREICLDASLSAKAMYLKRGYRETAYHTLRTKDNAFLCYDSMAKQLPHNPA